MTKCDEYRGRLADWQMGRPEAKEAADMEQHLKGCAACREALEATEFVLNSLDNLQDPEPSAQMKAHFRKMLDEFKAREDQLLIRGRIWTWLLQPRLSLAYGLIVLLCGGVIFWCSKRNSPEQSVGQMHTQRMDTKQSMMLAMLDNPLASERMKAVNYTNDLKKVDKRVINALLVTLNNDPDVNVRLSALEALAALGDRPEVRARLIKSITIQDSPIIQLAIADVMLKLQAKGSISSFKQLLKQKDLDENVRQKVKETITQLI